MIQLVARNGKLCVPNSSLLSAKDREFYAGGDPLLMHCPEEGDAEEIAWPEPNKWYLAAALYDRIEVGLMEFCTEVLLPDGTVFDINKKQIR